jgi:hypothetical protein
MIVMRETERNTTPVRSGNLRWAGRVWTGLQTAEATTAAGAPSFA